MKRIVITFLLVFLLAGLYNCQMENLPSTNNLDGFYPASEKMHDSRGTSGFLLDPAGWSSLYWMFKTPASEWAITNSSSYHTNADRWADDLYRYDGNTAGASTYAAASGTIIYAQTSSYVPEYGNQVVIQCDANPDFAIRYAHLATIAVQKNIHINAGDLIGTVGNTGTQADHLHFVLYKGINNATNIRDLAETGQTPQGGEAKAAYFNYDAGMPPVNSSNIYKWLGGTNWSAPTGGTAKSISTANNGNVWVVNNSGMLWKWDGVSWGNPVRNNDTVDVGCGAYGTIVITTGDRNSYGGQILKLVNGQWVEFAPGGRAYRVDVDSYDYVWVINRMSELFRWNGSWSKMLSNVQDIGCGPNGIVVATLNNDGADGGKIMKYGGGSNWTELGGRAVKVDVANDGSIWVINNKGMVYQNINGTWYLTKPSGGDDIGCGPVTGGIWITTK